MMVIKAVLLILLRVVIASNIPNATPCCLSGYEHLFKLRKQRYKTSEKLKDKKLNVAAKYMMWEEWIADPAAWDELAAEFMEEKQPLLAVEMYKERESRLPYTVSSNQV